jgi:hypothetical protein
MSSKIKIKSTGTKKHKKICDAYVPGFVGEYGVEKIKISSYMISLKEDSLFQKDIYVNYFLFLLLITFYKIFK